MKIPEAHICDAAGCMKDAWYRITHEILRYLGFMSAAGL